ncbi:hypothetical protein GS889_18245 [Rhodococcus hoagii]|nr:hypothetical protein [Prescottella equi]
MIRFLLHRRLIFSKSSSEPIRLDPPPEHWLDDDHTVRQLTDETVVRAIGYFKTDVLQKNKWDVDKGASIRTFFIGQCLFQFANVYKVWFNEDVSGEQPSS